MKKFLEKYNNEPDLVEKLTLMYDFVDDTFKSNIYEALDVLKQLLMKFNDEKYHLSELKTLLVISKPFKNNTKIKKERSSLLNTYNEKKIKTN